VHLCEPISAETVERGVRHRTHGDLGRRRSDHEQVVAEPIQSLELRVEIAGHPVDEKGDAQVLGSFAWATFGTTHYWRSGSPGATAQKGVRPWHRGWSGPPPPSWLDEVSS
jgi:hypothetical protein